MALRIGGVGWWCGEGERIKVELKQEGVGGIACVGRVVKVETRGMGVV